MSRLAPAVAASVATVVLSLALAPPAVAAGTYADLPADPSSCTVGQALTVVLSDDITGDPRLNIGCDVTIELVGFTLDTGGVSILPGASLTVEDAAGTGRLLAERTTGGGGIEVPSDGQLTINGGSIAALGVGGRAAIGGHPYPGSITVNGGSVTARAENRMLSPAGAAIGGAFGGNGGTVTVNGGTVVAQGASYIGDTTIYSTPAIGSGSFAEHGGSLTVNSGSVTALADPYQYHSAAIGGGYRSAGSDVVINGGTVTVSGVGGGAWGTFGAGIGGTGFGSLDVGGDLRLPSGKLTIPTGAEVVVAETGRIAGSEADPTAGAAISGEGRIVNRGVIALDAALVGALVTHNAFDVDFVAPGGGAAASVTVFAPSFASGHRSVPAPPAGARWATAPDGTGEWFTAQTALTPGDSSPTAVTVYGVTGFPALATDLADCTDGTTVALPGDLSGDELEIPCDLTLDLAGHELTLDHVDVRVGSSLTIDDTVGGGTLVAETNDDDAAIGIPDGAALTVRAGTVTARADSGAGIGGDHTGSDVGETAGAVTVTGGTVTAGSAFGGAGIGGGLGYLGSGAGGDVLITGGSVVADGGESAAGIGGGRPWSPNSSVSYPGGAGGSVRIEGGQVTATGATGIGAAPAGSGGSVHILGGTVTTSGWHTALGSPLAFDGVLIGSGATVHVPSGAFRIPDTSPDAAEVTIEPGGRLLGSAADPTAGAAITGAGQIDNGGVIALAADLVDVTVLDNNHLLTFAGGMPDPAPVRVFADTVAAGYRSLPPLTAPDAWNTAADGSGEWVTEATPLTADATLHAATDATLTLTAAATTVGRGGSVAFQVTGVDRNGDPVDTSAVVLTSSVATDVIDGLTVTFPHASPHVITATLGTASASVTIEVVPPLPATGGTIDTGAIGLGVLLLLTGGLALARGIRRPA